MAVSYLSPTAAGGNATSPNPPPNSQTAYQNNINDPGNAALASGGMAGYNQFSGNEAATEQANQNANLFGQIANYATATGNLAGNSLSNQYALSNVGAYNGTLNGQTLQQAQGLNNLNSAQNNNQIGLDQATLQYLSQLGGVQKTNNDQTISSLNNLMGDYTGDQAATTQQTAAQSANATNQEAQDILANTQAQSKEKSSEIAGGGYGAAGYNQDLGAYNQQASLLGSNLASSLSGIQASGKLAQGNINEQIERFVNQPMSNQNAQYATQQLGNANNAAQANSDITQQNLANMANATKNAQLSNQYSDAATQKAQTQALQQQNINQTKFYTTIQALQSAATNASKAGLL